MIILGIDPGDSTALALVVLAPVTGLRLVGLWQVYGASEPWHRRLDVAVAEALALADGLGPLVVWMEAPPPSYSGTRDGRRVNHQTAAHSIGEARGAIRGALRAAGVPMASIRDVPSGRSGWWGAMRVGAKIGDGTHRIREARLVAGAWEALEGLPADTDAARARVVDAAEAILIGAAGAVAGGGVLEKGERPR